MPKVSSFDVLFIDNCQSNPGPLPTPNDIDGSEVLLKKGNGCRVVRVQQRFVMKFGVCVYPTEAYNMLYVARSTTVPVPKVYAIYQSKNNTKNNDGYDSEEEADVVTYIVMEHIPGSTLLDSWGSLDQTCKTTTAKTLRTYFDQLRRLPHPNYFGNIDGGSLLDEMFSATMAGKNIKTSCTTEDEVINYVIQIYSQEGGRRLDYKTRYCQHVLPTVLRGNGSPVFTHCDFQRKNVMVQPDGALVLIDWECASWCPTYWEYSAATFANGGWRDDWQDYVLIVLDEYPNQSLWLSSMRLEILC